MDESIEVEFKTPVGDALGSYVRDNSPLAGFLGAISKDADKLSAISDFFRGDQKEFTDIDLLQAVRHIEARLGTPELNERRVDRVFRYITIQRQMDGLEKERDTLLR